MWFRREIICTRLKNRVKIEDIYKWFEEEEEEEEEEEDDDIIKDNKVFHSTWKQCMLCRHMDCH
jgi:hypothetical protein